MAATTRLFVALWPDKQTRDAIAAVQKQVMTVTGMMNNAVAYDNLHMTLRFLGNIPVSQIDEIERCLANIRAQPFQIQCERWGLFPRPGILWIGPSRTDGLLRQLHGDVATATNRYSCSNGEKTWQPHVTLFRKVHHLPEVEAFEPVAWRVDRIVLVASNTHPDGVKYTVMWEGAL